MFRHGHFLEPIKQLPKRPKFSTFDIESKHEDTQQAGFTTPFLVGYYDPENLEYESWRNEKHLSDRHYTERAAAPGGCIDKFMTRFLDWQYRNYVCYSHNGGNFDILFCLPWLKQHSNEFKWDLTPIQSSILSVTITRIKKTPEEKTLTWTFLDSLKLIPASLAGAAKMVGMEETKVDQDLNVEENDPSWDIYLKQDCRLLAGIMDRFIELIEKLGGALGMTAPSTAMKLIRMRFLNIKVPRHEHFPKKSVLAAWSSEVPDWACTCDPKPEKPIQGCLHEWVRRAYYGGRCEVMTMQGQGLHYFDINSSYVAAMREDMPAGDMLVEDHYEPKRYERNVGFVECVVEIPETCYLPPLPFVHPKLQKLTFPVGRIAGTWSVEELRLLEDPLVNGRIVSVKKAVWFKRKPFLKEFAETVWSLRAKQLPDGSPNPKFDESLSGTAKLMGNSGYGKFGMRQDREMVKEARYENRDTGGCIICGAPADEFEDDGQKKQSDFCEDCAPICKAADAGHTMFYVTKFVDAPYIIPQIAAHITALARVRLWKMMKRVVDTPGATLFYCDSVTGDRTTFVRSERGIEPLTFEALWERAEGTYIERGKEFGRLPGYETLTHEGWTPITRILRHRSSKSIHRLTTKHGQTEVTSDHGIMVQGRATRPDAFVRDRAKFTSVDPPEYDVPGVVDLFEYLKGWSQTAVRRARGPGSSAKPTTTERLQFTCSGQWVMLMSAWQEARGLDPLRIKRFYVAGSAEWHALLRLVSTYACDGSASIPGETTTTRYMLSFCKARLETIQRVKRDLETIAPGINVFGPHWTETTYVVRSGTQVMACLFAALCGVRSKAKRLPSFVFALDEAGYAAFMTGIVEGDGSKRENGTLKSFSTTSQVFAAGLSYVMAQHAERHIWSFRESKGAWSMYCPTGPERKRYSIKHEVREVGEAFVYDLSVDGVHTFVDGIGRVLLHNTDSVICDIELPSSNLLGDFKDEFPGVTLDGIFLQPKVYMLESQLDAEGKPTKDWKDNAKVTMKGFAKDERTRAGLDKLRRGEQLTFTRLQKVRTLLQHGLARGPQMVTITKGFKSKYNKRQIMADGMSTSPIVVAMDDDGNFLDPMQPMSAPVSGTIIKKRASKGHYRKAGGDRDE